MVDKSHLHPFYWTFMSSKRFELPVWRQRQLECRDGGISFLSVQSGLLNVQIKVFIKVDESPSRTIMMEEVMLFSWSKKEKNCYFDWQGRAELWVSTHVLGLIKPRRIKEYLQIIQIVGPTVNPAGGAFKNAIPWALQKNVALSPIRARPCCKVEHARGAEAWNHCRCDDMLNFTFAPLPKGEINEVWRNTSETLRDWTTPPEILLSKNQADKTKRSARSILK